MRPVNLIPPDQRRGDQRQMRTGPVAYVVLGALVVILAGVAAIVLTDNQIADRKAEVARLEREEAAAKARAARFASYTEFHSLREQRMATITSLADSRFDWERVLRELARVIPRGVWLTSLTGNASASDSSTSSDSSDSAASDPSIAGPSLSMAGCAVGGHDRVAALITALKDIDGVTRVGLQTSAVGGDEDSSAGECSSGASFTLLAAFDAAPVPSATPAAPTDSATPSSSSASSSDATSTPTSTTAEGG